tara:strand:+ start:12598 stop:12789 length:192 start_codon:yes stop_codon:yes gene_type:complete
MSGEIIDIKAALEERQFKAKEDRLTKMREAFRAARLGANEQIKSKASTLKDAKRKKKGRKSKR